MHKYTQTSYGSMFIKRRARCDVLVPALPADGGRLTKLVWRVKLLLKWRPCHHGGVTLVHRVSGIE